MRSKRIPPASRRVVSLLTASIGALLVACGGKTADVPPDLLDAIKHPEGSGNYPPAPYGTRAGDTVQNLCFDGWKDPKAAGFDPSAFTRICFADYHDPTGTTAKLLLVESCTVWCAACRSEYEGSGNRPSLTDQLTTRAAEGFRVMGTIFQDAAANPATATDAASWARTYDLAFPFALDQDHQLELFSPSTVAPFNMLIDTMTMKIVLELQGDEPATLFQAADDFLAKHASP
jgi:hypothetical protein